MVRLGWNVREYISLAVVLAEKDVKSDVIGSAIGAPLAEEPSVLTNGEVTTIAVGPGAWFVLKDKVDQCWQKELSGLLTGLAAVSDQSASYVVCDLTGPDAHRVLQCGAYVDLDPQIFVPGKSAATVISYIPTIIWRTDDSDRYSVAFYRSYLSSFRSWLEYTVETI